MSDGNACTVDSCDPTTGQPTYPPVPNGTSCSDQNACTTNDRCSAAICGGTPKPPISDGNACTLDSCNPATGQPVYPPGPDGTTCNDQNYCTTADRCSAGLCAGTPKPLVSDGNGCTMDSCDPATGYPAYPLMPDGTACVDGNACTIDDRCGSGQCSGTPKPIVGDGNVCTSDRCDLGTGEPVYDPIAAGAVCETPTGDGLCNGAGTCIGASVTTFCYDSRGHVTRKHVCPSGQSCPDACTGTR